MIFDGLYCKHPLDPKINPGWIWWSEISSLSDEYQNYASGCPFFGLLGIRKDILQKTLEDKYDELFEKDIHCELRFATLIKYLGYNIYKIPTNIATYFLDGTQSAKAEKLLTDNIKGLIHPIKKKY